MSKATDEVVQHHLGSELVRAKEALARCKEQIRLIENGISCGFIQPFAVIDLGENARTLGLLCAKQAALNEIKISLNKKRSR